MAGKHSSDDDFNPYRRQNSNQSGEKSSVRKNYNQDYGTQTEQ